MAQQIKTTLLYTIIIRRAADQRTGTQSSKVVRKFAQKQFAKIKKVKQLKQIYNIKINICNNIKTEEIIIRNQVGLNKVQKLT